MQEREEGHHLCVQYQKWIVVQNQNLASQGMKKIAASQDARQKAASRLKSVAVRLFAMKKAIQQAVVAHLQLMLNLQISIFAVEQMFSSQRALFTGRQFRGEWILQFLVKQQQ